MKPITFTVFLFIAMALLLVDPFKPEEHPIHKLKSNDTLVHISQEDCIGCRH